MKLDFIALDRLYVDKANMRFAKKPPDVSDILPTVRKRGVLQPLIVRPGEGERFGIVAGRRRFCAAQIADGERRAANDDQPDPDPDPVLLPCAILDAGDDADAVEASLIENIARLDPDEVTQWATFTRLVKEGRGVAEIAATFGLPDLAVRRILALGHLLPRIRDLYAREEIDRATVRLLTMASKRQQQDWLKLVDDPDTRAPHGANLKAWLLGGQSIPVAHAVFDLEGSGLAIVADLFGEGACFADAQAFWAAQNAAVEALRTAYVEQGWSDAVIVPPSDYFQSWEYEKAGKRKGGQVWLDVKPSGEVVIHQGYVARSRSRAGQRGGGEASAAKAGRPEVTSTLQTYIDLHRHAAVRADLTGHPGIALRLMVAHAIAGSPLWTVRVEPQSLRNDAARESVETSRGETLFDERRRAVLDLLGFGAEEVTVTGGCGEDIGWTGDRLSAIFARLLDLPDTALLDVIAVVIGETLCAGSPVVERLGLTLGIDMTEWWQADPVFFDLVRDKEALAAMVGDVAGPVVAEANARETGKTLKTIIGDHLAGAGGRPRIERWAPRWMTFPPAAYTPRGGVGTVAAHARAVTGLAPDAAGPETREPAVLDPTDDPERSPDQDVLAGSEDDGEAATDDHERLAA